MKRIAQKNVKYCDEKIQPNPKNSSNSKNCSVRLKLTANRTFLFYLQLSVYLTLILRNTELIRNAYIT